MVEINLPKPESPDIYSYGYGKDLNREAEKKENPLIFDVIRDSIQGQRIQPSSIVAGADNTIIVLDSSKGFWAGHKDFSSAPFSVNLSGESTLSAPYITTPYLVRSHTSTAFETSSRFTSTLSGTGTTTFGTNGVELRTGAGAGGSSARLLMQVGGTGSGIFGGIPIFSALFSTTRAPSAYTIFIGIGAPSFSAGFTDTSQHVGFQYLSGTPVAIRGSTGDGTNNSITGNLAASGEPLGTNMAFHVVAIERASNKVDFYFLNTQSSYAKTWQKASLTTNIPSFTTNEYRLVAGLYNNGAGTDASIECYSMSYDVFR